MENKYLRHSIVMILLFLVGGFFLILFVFQMYSALLGFETFTLTRERMNQNSSLQLNRSLGERFEQPLINETPPESQFPFGRFPRVLMSPFSLMSLIIGISSTLGGISIWQLTREKELKSVKENITSLLLTPEERAIIEELKKANGKLNQNQLVKKTGFSRVKVHRALVRLGSRKIIKKYPYGLTNMIILEKKEFK